MEIFYECGICGHCHPWDWNGDCRDDANRFTNDQLDVRFGGESGYELRTMEQRVFADSRE